MPQALTQPDPQLFAWAANQRFLNALATLDRLLRDDFGGFPDPSVRAAVTAFSSHIQALASMHRALGDMPGEPALDAGAYLARLCHSLCAVHLAPRGASCEVQVEPAVLPREVCRGLGLIVVELVTNAAKHAFTGRTGGRVWVTLRSGQRGWICQVADNGAGLTGGVGAGCGLKLVRGLATTLGAKLDINSDDGGATITVRLPDPTLRRWRRA